MSVQLYGTWYVVNPGKNLRVRAVRGGKNVLFDIPEGFYVLFECDRLVAIAQPEEYQGFATFSASQDAINAACTPLPEG